MAQRPFMYVHRCCVCPSPPLPPQSRSNQLRSLPTTHLQLCFSSLEILQWIIGENLVASHLAVKSSPVQSCCSARPSPVKPGQVKAWGMRATPTFVIMLLNPMARSIEAMCTERSNSSSRMASASADIHLSSPLTEKGDQGPGQTGLRKRPVF